jgi:hypothetical protein
VEDTAVRKSVDLQRVSRVAARRHVGTEGLGLTLNFQDHFRTLVIGMLAPHLKSSMKKICLREDLVGGMSLVQHVVKQGPPNRLVTFRVKDLRVGLRVDPEAEESLARKSYRSDLGNPWVSVPRGLGTRTIPKEVQGIRLGVAARAPGFSISSSKHRMLVGPGGEPKVPSRNVPVLLGDRRKGFLGDDVIKSFRGLEKITRILNICVPRFANTPVDSRSEILHRALRD